MTNAPPDPRWAGLRAGARARRLAAGLLTRLAGPACADTAYPLRPLRVGARQKRGAALAGKPGKPAFRSALAARGAEATEGSPAQAAALISLTPFGR